MINPVDKWLQAAVDIWTDREMENNVLVQKQSGNLFIVMIYLEGGTWCS